MAGFSKDGFAERTSTANVDRGLYVLRYVDSAAESAPSVFVGASRGSEDVLTFVTSPDASTPVLTIPGSVLVIRADARSSIQMTARSSRPGGSVDANLRLEPLHDPALLEPSPANRAAPTREAYAAPSANPVLSIVGHVSRRGDVAVQPGGWIAGPSDPAPIEGIEIAGSLPAGLVLDYQVTAQNTNWSNWAGLGTFLGSKGRFAALTGVRLRLGGPSADAYAIKASALFLGSSALNEMGQTVELRSATGHDPLVGLKLELVAREIRTPAPPARISSPEQPAVERKSRVRVFRAGAEQKSL